MSTRGLLGFIQNDEIKATYNHSDSYPSWLGIRVLEFVRAATSGDGAQLDLVRKLVATLTLIEDEQESPTDAERAELAKVGIEHADNVSTGDDWYAWLRSTQGDLLAILKSGFMIDGGNFGNDSLFCEWGYLINLDDNTIEVYEGYQKEEHTEGRFASSKPADWKPTYAGQDWYAPIKLIATYSFGSLPSNEDMNALEGGEEE